MVVQGRGGRRGARTGFSNCQLMGLSQRASAMCQCSPMQSIYFLAFGDVVVAYLRSFGSTTPVCRVIRSYVSVLRCLPKSNVYV